MKRWIVFYLLFIFGIARSQTPWDLQECINYALAHNIGLRQASLNNEVNKNLSTQSKAAILPSLNAGASHVYNFGKTIDRFTNTFAEQRVLSQNFFISSNVTLWSGLSQFHNIKANEYNYLSSVERLKQQENDLSLNVANAYIGVIFSEELLKISQNQYNITEEQLQRTQKLVNAGAVAKSVEYDLKAQLANEEVNMTTAQNNVQLSFLALRQLMNFDSVTNFSIARPNVDAIESSLLENNITSIYETSLKNQPVIKSGEYSILSAEKNLAASRGRRSPILSLNASMGTGTSELAKDIIEDGYAKQVIGVTENGSIVYTPVPIMQYHTQPTSFSDQFSNNINRSIGLTLSIPLFNGLQTHTSVKNAQINAFNTKLSQDLTKQNLYKNITQAHANAKAALNKYAASKSSVDAAGESFKYAQQKFNAGVFSVFDFNASKNRLFTAESNLLQAKYDYLFKLKVLDYYQGKPLGF